MIEDEVKILACKHASSTSAIQQMADVGRQFAIFKSCNKTMTSTNLPSGFGLKGQIEYELDALNAKGILMLKLPARKAIIDHVVTCPNIYAISMQPKTTKKGFIENGMLDEKTDTYPDIYKMMKTCKLKEFKQEYEDLVLNNFSELYQCMKSHGHIPEEVYDRLGFVKDTNYDGKVVEKPDTISQEMRHRAKILSHKLQCDLRRKKEEDAALVIKKKTDHELILRNELFKKNDCGIRKLLKTVPQDDNEDDELIIEHLPIDAFQTLLKEELKGFIHVRLFNEATIPKGERSLMPTKKGKLVDAKEGEENNLVRIAFNSRMLPYKLSRPETNEDGDAVLIENYDDVVRNGGDNDKEAIVDIVVEEEVNSPQLIFDSSAFIITPPRLSNLSKSESLPSNFLETTNYMALLVANIRGTHNIELLTSTEEKKIFADRLGRLLHRRLAKHIHTKIDDPSKHNHPALLFVRANLNRFAAMLVFFGQARISPVLNMKSCLLEDPVRGSFLIANDDQLEGSYLHYHKEGLAWVRSGKAVGSDTSSPVNGLVLRNEKGHRKKAATSSLLDGQCFYTLFPSQTNESQLPNKLGYFEELTLYCGFSFNRRRNTEGLTSIKDDTSIFDWSLYIKRLTDSRIHGATTLCEKQLVVVGYFFEMCYDICLQEKHNVSNNPGFESILGVFDNRDSV